MGVKGRQAKLNDPHDTTRVVDVSLSPSLADPEGQGGHARQTCDHVFCSAKTDFRTNWLTPQVMAMQKDVQLEGGLCP